MRSTARGRSPPSPTSCSSGAPRPTRFAAPCAASPRRRRSRPPCSLPAAPGHAEGAGAPILKEPRAPGLSTREYQRKSMFVFKAAVVGAGTMGGEIAQVIAAAGLPVVLKDVKQEFVDQGLEKAREVSQGQLGGLVKKEKITQEQADQQLEEIVGRIQGTTEYDGFGDVDFVIEAVPERMEIKQSVFAELDELTPGHAILASNTSSLSITEMGEATGRPDKVVGFHFFYPASVMRLIEVIQGDDTSEETMQG